MGYTGDGVGTNAAGTKTGEEGSAMARWGRCHGDLWAKGSSGGWTVRRRRDGQRVGDGERDKRMRWKIQAVVMVESGRLTGGNGARGKTDFKAQRRVGEVLMKKSKVWMKPRETHSVKESVGGSRYYRTDASGRDRDGRQEFG